MYASVFAADRVLRVVRASGSGEVRLLESAGVSVGGSPVSPDKLKQGVEIFGPCMCESYGQTEAPMLMTFLDAKTLAAAAAGGDHPERLRSCGKPTSAVRLAIMDDVGQILPGHERRGVRGARVWLPAATSTSLRQRRRFGASRLAPYR